MFDWLRKLFRKKPKFQKGLTPDRSAEIRIVEELERLEREEALDSFHPHSVDDLRKYAQQQRIARQNMERQKATLGYGLKNRNFRPRPAFEKQLWNLQKKPSEEDD